MATLEELPLPVAHADLIAWSNQAEEAASRRFDKQMFAGGKVSRAAALQEALSTAIHRDFGCSPHRAHPPACCSALNFAVWCLCTLRHR